MKKPQSLLLIILISFKAFSQPSNKDNTLLWRISGKGLVKPSYLFGTMHLSDKRIFQLGDSVYKALEQTEGFAAELDMNRMGTQMINYFIREDEEKKATEPPLLKDVVRPETWVLYKDSLEKKFGIKANRLTVDDLDALESRLETDIIRKGDMPTFLDAWLFGLAKKHGKWVGGVEDFQDQFDIEDDIEEKIQLALFDDKYYRGDMNWLMNLYIKQKLDSIDAFFYRNAADGKKDYILVRRNVKMARRMDSLSAIRSMLFAVGAAHLPGDSGVISLLRKRGFTVEPVAFSKRINPDKYVVKTNDVRWETIMSKDSSYSLKMPGIGETIELFETYGMDVKLYFDLSIMAMYMTFSVDLPNERKKIGADSLYLGMRNRFAEKGKVLREGPVMVNGIEGKETLIEMAGTNMKLQVFLPEMEKAVLNAVYSLTERALEESDTRKFFESFVYYKDRPKKAPVEKTWSRMDFPIQSFSIEIPVKPKETKDVVSEQGKTAYAWQGVDIKEQVFYGMNVTMMKEGMFNSGSDSTYFKTLQEQLKANFGNPKTIDSSYLSFNGYPAFKFVMQGKAEGDIINISVLSVIRGGLIYYIYTVYDPHESAEIAADRFINSFRLQPYRQPEWKIVESADGTYSSKFPYSMKPKELEDENDIHPVAERSIVYDPAGAVSLYVDKTILPAWFWYSSDTAFLRSRSLEYVGEEDSLVAYKITEEPNKKILDFLITRPEEDLMKKVRIILTGNELYDIYGHFSKIDEPVYSRFFYEFKVKNELPISDRLVSRTADLAELLKDPDEKKITMVKSLWYHLPFSQQDLPILQKLALRLYPDFDTVFQGNLNAIIFDQLAMLDTAEQSSITYFKDQIGSIGEENEYVKIFVLSWLSGIQTKESYAVIKDILTKHPPKLMELPYVSHSFYDSLELTATLFPEAMQLASSPALWDLISGITTSLIDSSLLDKSQVRLYGKEFISSAKRLLEGDKDEMEESAWLYGDLIRILGMINNPESAALLAKFGKFNSKFIRLKTTIALLENNQPADSRTIYTLAITDEFRISLYDELKRIGKLKLFPAEFLSQKELGKSMLYGVANEEEQPESVAYVGEKTILYEGKQQKFLLYRIAFTGPDLPDYLGVAGPYSTNPKDFSSDHKITGIHWEVPYVYTKLDEMFKDYMASFDE